MNANPIESSELAGAGVDSRLAEAALPGESTASPAGEFREAGALGASATFADAESCASTAASDASGLFESEERLRLALEGADLGSWDVDLRTGLAVWNRRHKLVQGYSAEVSPVSLELWRQRVHPEDLPMVVSALEKARAEKRSFAVEHRCYRADDGQLRWLALHGRFYYDDSGAATRLSGVSRDITEQKVTERRLAADLDAMTRLQALSALSVAGDGMQVFLDQIVETAVAIMEADFGNLQLIDAETSQLRMVAAQGFPAWWLEFWRSTAEARGSCSMAVELGERTIVEDVQSSPLFATRAALEIQTRAGIRAVQSTPLISRSGKKLGALSTHYKTVHRPDDRQLRLIDLLARQAADLIERAQAEEDLRQAKIQAEAASAAKDKFIAALSHELRTPLMPVLIASSAYERSPDCPLEFRQVFSMVRRNIELEKQLIDDLLDVARIGEGTLHLQRQSCDLHSILWNAARLLRTEMDAKKLELRLELQAQNAHLVCDPVRLQQVVWNLLRNAIKFTPRGGLNVLRTRQEGSELRVSVIDSGIGISETDLGRIFDAFEQSAAGAAPRYGGLGLGLAISASIVSAHGGRIWAESEGEGRGATFHLALPQASGSEDLRPSKPAPTSTQDSLRAASQRILLVEDHEPTRCTLSLLLARAGYTVKSAETVADALALASQHTFDLLISDIGLPDGNGHQLMRQLQARYHLVGIALSGFGMDEDIRRSSEAGFAAHLVKPVTLQMVESALEKLLLVTA